MMGSHSRSTFPVWNALDEQIVELLPLHVLMVSWKQVDSFNENVDIKNLQQSIEKKTT